MIKLSLCFAVTIVGCSMFFYSLGEKMEHEAVVQRCLKIEDTGVYTQEQVTYIIFGEQQI